MRLNSGGWIEYLRQHYPLAGRRADSEPMNGVDGFHQTGVRQQRSRMSSSGLPGGRVKRWVIGYALAALAAATTASVTYAAERRYVTDACSIPVQSGPAPGYKIVRMVSSGTNLEILEPNTKGYTRIRTPEGISGWIMSEYLMEQPSARTRVAQMEARVTTMENENRTLRSEAETLRTARDEANQCGEELTTVRTTAAKTLEIDKENRQLEQEIEASQTRQQQLEAENATLRSQSNRNWFIAGAGTAFGGLLLGLVIPHIVLRRRGRRWDQF